MKNFLAVTAAAVVIAAALPVASAQAQTKAIEPAPVQPRELDPAKRVAAPAPEATTGQQPAPASTPTPAAAPAQPAPVAAPHYSARPSWEELDRGGFFVGAQGGQGWVYDSVRQDAWAINAGYRWQAGAVSLLGIELSAGRLDSTTDDGWHYNKIEYKSIGFNGRFNFGAASPVYALVRSGYFDADEQGYGSADGGYVGIGLGADITRNFNLSLVYTNYVYFNELYWEDGDLYYDASRSDALMLGVEARF